LCKKYLKLPILIQLYVTFAFQIRTYIQVRSFLNFQLSNFDKSEQKFSLISVEDDKSLFGIEVSSVSLSGNSASFGIVFASISMIGLLTKRK
jgi:hypothetical protein